MRTSGKTNSPPSCPNLHSASSGRAEKHIKRRAIIGPGASLLFTSFGSASPRASRTYFPLLSKENWSVTRSYNTGLSEEITRDCNTGLSKGCNTGPSVTSNFWWDKTEPRKWHTPPTFPYHILKSHGPDLTCYTDSQWDPAALQLETISPSKSHCCLYTENCSR